MTVIEVAGAPCFYGRTRNFPAKSDYVKKRKRTATSTIKLPRLQLSTEPVKRANAGYEGSRTAALGESLAGINPVPERGVEHLGVLKARRTAWISRMEI